MARTARTLLAAALACCALAAHAAPETWPAPSGSIPEPKDDPFYAAPPDAALAAAAPGEILRVREISARAYYAFPLSSKAWQLVLRSTDHKGRAVASVATVLVPKSAPASGRKLLAYNVAYDALTLRCAPSYMTAKGTALEQALIGATLNKGWVVVLPDYEGLQSLWTVGLNSGQGVLDAIRAAENFAPAGLAGASTPVAITGYSGGAVATTWANELQPTYAPELNIRGVAAGGVPVDLGNVARKVNGKVFAGLYFGAVAALARGYPEVDTDTLTNAKGKEMLAKAGEMCAAQFLTGAPDPVVSFIFDRMEKYTTVPQLLDVPVVKDVIAQNRLGQRRPGAPAYIYEGTVDEVMPIADVDALVAQYCGQGVKVQYNRVFSDHILLAVAGWGKAFNYLQDRLADKAVAVPSNCK